MKPLIADASANSPTCLVRAADANSLNLSQPGVAGTKQGVVYHFCVDIELLSERYAAQIAGVLSCWDRVLIFGTLPKISYPGGMTSFLHERQVRIFDYPKFAEPFRYALRENAERLAAEAGIEIEFIRKRNFRKEDRVKQALARHGNQPGLVHIFSAMEPCSTYKPWHDKQTGQTLKSA
jgi:hypothetical protein